MLKHKSFVLKSKNKSKAKVMSMGIKQSNTLAPKIAINKEDEQSSCFYDKNEKITLSLPQSLSYVEENFGDNSHVHSYDTPIYIDHSQANNYDYDEVDEERDEDYSDANSYFENENNYTNQQSSEVIKDDSSSNTKNNENLKKEEKEEKAHDAVVVNPDELLNEESIKEQDKKFEEDIAAILTGKKQFDKARVQKDPQEAIKDKNHGLFDKKEDKAIEDKLKNDHAIFDKIAQSMEMASSYDLGSIAMDKKFDFLEKETDKDFTKKIHELIEEDKPKQSINIEDTEKVNADANDINVETENHKQKVETKDFLNDLDKISTIEKNHKKEVLDTLSTQSSFTSTISIKHRYLKSRVFAVIGSAVEVKIDSNWTPTNCSDIQELNVTLTKSIDYWPDDEISTKKFRIGGPDTKTWNDLASGNYYLTFFFASNTNPYCELSGTIEVKA